ncbi:TPA: helix-turn-helix domain-containing protein, partial [Enterococcus faecium]
MVDMWGNFYIKGEFLMIEQYIEKDILRQIKFVEYLLDNDKLRVSDLAKHFSVSNQTIFNDMENINVTL